MKIFVSPREIRASQMRSSHRSFEAHNTNSSGSSTHVDGWVLTSAQDKIRA